MKVIPPGVDLGRFGPPVKGALPSEVEREVNRFLTVPEKPIVLALSRPDPRKNIPRLVEAFALHPHLREVANLVLIAGNRDHIRDLDRGARETWWKVLELVDEHDLYGSMAYPKHHRADDVAELYRLATVRRGVFVNAALTEPFGLTLLEAAASGVPVVATNDGGPREILARCKNGTLVDPLDVAGLGEGLFDALTDRTRWRRWQKNGLRGVERHYSWRAHVDSFMGMVRSVTAGPRHRSRAYKPKGRLLTADRLIVTDIDNTLIGPEKPLRELMRRVAAAGGQVAFGIATGRRIDQAQDVLEEHDVPPPDFLITSVGSSIHYGSGLVEDRTWHQHINYRWRPDRLRQVAEDFEALTLQGPEGQDAFKVSYTVDTDLEFDAAELQAALRRARLQARLEFSHGAFLDLLPVRASKGLAVRYLAMRLGIPLDMVLVAGASGSDEEMLRGNTLGVVVGSHDDELSHLEGQDRIYFAQGTHARGITEGIEHYAFLD